MTGTGRMPMRGIGRLRSPASSSGIAAVLAGLLWVGPAAAAAPIPVSLTLVAARASLPAAVSDRAEPFAPAQDPVIPEPVIPQPVIPQPPVPVAQPDPVPAVLPDPVPVAQPDPVPAVLPDPVPVAQPDPVAVAQPDPVPVVQPPVVAPELPVLTPQSPELPAAGSTPLFPSELSAPGLPAVGSPAPALTAPELTAPALTGPEFPPAPLAALTQPGPPMEDPTPAPWIQPLDPGQQSLTSSGCPYTAGPGALLPPSVWSVCPTLEPGLTYSPYPAYSPLRKPWELTSSFAQQISIPWVTGYRADSAAQTLALAGLNVGSVTEHESASPLGTVLRTDPPFGSAVEFGRAVNLVVAGP